MWKMTCLLVSANTFFMVVRSKLAILVPLLCWCCFLDYKKLPVHNISSLKKETEKGCQGRICSVEVRSLIKYTTAQWQQKLSPTRYIWLYYTWNGTTVGSQ